MQAMLQRLVFIVMMAIVCAGCSPPVTIESERAKLQGTWEVVAGEERGMKSLASVGNRYTFEGSTFEVNGHPKRAYELNVNASPKQMNWPAETDTQGKKIVETAKAIYCIDGDELRICVVRWGTNPRPVSFSTSRDGHSELMVLKRIKPSAKGGEDHEGSHLPDSWYQERAFYKLQPRASSRDRGKFSVDFYRGSIGPQGIPRITEADWKYVVDLRDIRNLVLRACPDVGNEEMRYVAKLVSLERLDLHSTAVGDVGIAQLSRLNNLERLDLSFTSVSDAGLATVVKMEKLKRLVLKGTTVTDKGIENLCAARKDLEIDWPRPYTESQQKAAASLSRLGLEIDDGIDQFVQPKTATCQITIQVRVSSLADKEVEKPPAAAGYAKSLDASVVAGYLEKLPAPTSVSVADQAMDDSIFSCIRDIQGLVRLNLRSTHVTDAGLAELKRHKNLKALDLSYAKRITDKGVADLASLTNLERLDLAGLELTPDGLTPLLKLDHLKELSLDRGPTNRDVHDKFRRKGVKLRIR